MEFLNIESGEINLIISYESQNVEKIKCKASDKMEDILSAFAQKKNVDYSSFLILYSGKELHGSDLKKNNFSNNDSNRQRAKNNEFINLFQKFSSTI